MSRQVLFDLIPLSLHFSATERVIPLVDLLLPVASRAERKSAIIQILAWLKDLRRWFAEPGPILPKLGQFFDNLGLPAYRNIRFRSFDEIGDEFITGSECDTYCLCIASPVEPIFVSLSRDIGDEEFSTLLALHLMM